MDLRVSSWQCQDCKRLVIFWVWWNERDIVPVYGSKNLSDMIVFKQHSPPGKGPSAWVSVAIFYFLGRLTLHCVFISLQVNFSFVIIWVKVLLILCCCIRWMNLHSDHISHLSTLLHFLTFEFSPYSFHVCLYFCIFFQCSVFVLN